MSNKYTKNAKNRSIYYWSWLVMLFLGTFITIGFTFLILFYIIINGLQHFHFDMLAKPYNSKSPMSGGMGPFLLSSLMILFLTMVLSVPLCLFFSIYYVEYLKNPRAKEIILSTLNVLNSIPSIIFGIIGNTLFVVTFHLGYTGFSILSGSLTLFLVIFPILSISMIQAMTKVSRITIESSYALGSTKWQTIYKVLLPESMKSMSGGIILSISRVLGESAPVYLTVGASVFAPTNFLDQGRSLVVCIFLLFQNPSPGSTDFIYSMAFVLIFLIFIIIVTTRIFFFFIDKTNIQQKRKLKGVYEKIFKR